MQNLRRRYSSLIVTRIFNRLLPSDPDRPGAPTIINKSNTVNRQNLICHCEITLVSRSIYPIHSDTLLLSGPQIFILDILASGREGIAMRWKKGKCSSNVLLYYTRLAGCWGEYEQKLCSRGTFFFEAVVARAWVSQIRYTQTTLEKKNHQSHRYLIIIMILSS